jgi:dimeric dUTPase (all-alpha-NTP-PPase superfamily)
VSNWNWLGSTYALQRDVFGRTLPIKNPIELADFVVMNHTSAVTELSEFMDEVGWKNWTENRGWVNRDAAVGELVDVAHFVANLLCALGVTDDEWEQRYRNKQEMNKQRQRTGYDGVSNKCLRCKRALDEVEFDPVSRICVLCG